MFLNINFQAKQTMNILHPVVNGATIASTYMYNYVYVYV